jgi:hypothetical protein
VRRLRRWERQPISSLDLAFGSFAIGNAVIGFLVLYLSRSPDLYGLDTLRNLLSPIQLFVIYLIFSRLRFGDRGVATILNLVMAASIIVSLLATAELLNLPGVRDLVANYFPPFPTPPTWDPVYRPTSTLGHYSAVGAFCSINFILALALAAGGHRAFNRPWLGAVMAANLAGLVSSLTWAPLLVLPLATGIVLWQARRIPRELGVALAALALAFFIAWPSVSARSTEQDVFAAGQEFVIPQTFQHRIMLWNAFFLPALSDHLWFGTGTVIPSQVPDPLLMFVDNEYLHEGFRGGLLGVALLVVLLGTIGLAAWRQRSAPDATNRSIGAAMVALVIYFGLIGMTAEYLFFGGVSQEFGLLTGLIGGMATARQPLRAPSRALALAAMSR